jgi:Tfp pilus assembly protein PilP
MTGLFASLALLVALVAQEPPGYDPGGRRDPFVSLLVRGAEPASAARRAHGVAGALITEVVLKGIVTNRGRFMAMLQAPDGRTYLVRPGDHLRDGTVKTISIDTVVFVQQVRDPLSRLKQQEVRRSLRTTEVVK